MSVQEVFVWLGRYQQYLGQAQAYLSQQYPGSDILAAVEQQIANIDPNINLTNVTYGELVSDYNAIYSGLIQWYGTFFGTDGIITVN
jgi:hypothetical protein